VTLRLALRLRSHDGVVEQLDLSRLPRNVRPAQNGTYPDSDAAVHDSTSTRNSESSDEHIRQR
jgi:hypothetical protein